MKLGTYVNQFYYQHISPTKFVGDITTFGQNVSVLPENIGCFFLGGGGAFHFIEIQSAFFHIFRTDRKFLTKFANSEPTFNRSILTLLYLIFEISAFISAYYLQLSLHDMNLKLTSRIRFDEWSWPMTSSTWSRDFFLKMYFGL